jgi:hypothetical protein
MICTFGSRRLFFFPLLPHLHFEVKIHNTTNKISVAFTCKMTRGHNAWGLDPVNGGKINADLWATQLLLIGLVAKVLEGGTKSQQCAMSRLTCHVMLGTSQFFTSSTTMVPVAILTSPVLTTMIQLVVLSVPCWMNTMLLY